MTYPTYESYEGITRKYDKFNPVASQNSLDHSGPLKFPSDKRLCPK